ncbi:uncharacterized protein RHO25_007843 [Cercospora beticola]|uniref:F-box domain-containing protein n=1 Tax=Cercospora beticola TaxID=122368 RepID=A0ABZ0NUR5_CERBT|nr:hypothetical protein RHO25_007843 [Cercospora beticola]CAK1358073.1 unnamed protein product [Cercospora beticola]
MDKTTSLRELMQSLPQELYDEIYNLTFTANQKVLYVTRTYHPPHLTRIDHNSRTKFVASYYRNTTFLFTRRRTFRSWKRALAHFPDTAFHKLYLAIVPQNRSWYAGEPESLCPELGIRLEYIEAEGIMETMLMQEAEGDLDRLP